MTQDQFDELKRICINTHLEVLHLKKLLCQKNVISDDDIHEWPNSLSEYLNELDGKARELVKQFPHLGDQQ